MNKKTPFNKRVDSIKREMNELYDVYLKAHEELKRHEGKLIDEIGLENVNKMLADIQDAFKNVYPIIHFIDIHHQFAQNVLKNYTTFIEAIKKEGAKESPEAKA